MKAEFLGLLRDNTRENAFCAVFARKLEDKKSDVARETFIYVADNALINVFYRTINSADDEKIFARKKIDPEDITLAYQRVVAANRAILAGKNLSGMETVVGHRARQRARYDMR